MQCPVRVTHSLHTESGPNSGAQEVPNEWPKKI